MSRALHAVLSRRGRQIMDILMAELPNEPSYSTVRTQLRVLEQKGHVRHEAVHPDGASHLRSMASLELSCGLCALVLTSVLTSMPMPTHE